MINMDGERLVNFLTGYVAATHGTVVTCHDSESLRLAAEFAASPNATHLFVTSNDSLLYTSLEPKSSSFSIVIKSGPLDDSPLADQLHVLHVPKSQDAFESLQGLVKLAIAPLFDHASANELSPAVSSTRKKFNELNLSLRQLHQRVKTPDLLLALTPQLRAQLLAHPEDAQEVQEPHVLNALTAVVNLWISQIKEVSSLSRAPTESNTIHDELQFWLALEAALVSVQRQLSLPEVQKAIAVLNVAKRFQVTLAFLNNLGVTERLAETSAFTALLKDLPIDGIHYKEQTLASFESSLAHLFAHLRKSKPSSIPLSQMTELTELLLRESTQNLALLLPDVLEMSEPLAKFTSVARSVRSLLDSLDENTKNMINLVRESMRRRQEKFVIVKINLSSLDRIRGRVEELVDLKTRHEHLLSIIAPLENDSNHFRNSFSKYILVCNPFDFSKPGLVVWKDNVNAYSQAYARLLKVVAEYINARLELCEAPSDLCHVLSDFATVSNTQSLQHLLDDKHRLRALESALLLIQQLFDANKSFISTNFLDALHWCISLTGKANDVIAQLNDIFGTTWENYSLGAKISLEANALMCSIDPEAKVDEWSKTAIEEMRRFHLEKPLISISDDVSVQLPLNGDIFHEALQLTYLNFSLPASVKSQVEKFRALQQLAVTISEHIDVYNHITTDLLDGEFGIKYAPLFLNKKLKAQEAIRTIASVTWSDIHNDMAVLTSNSITAIDRLLDAIGALHSLVTNIKRIFRELQIRCFDMLKECAFTKQEVSMCISTTEEHVSKVIRSGEYDSEVLRGIVHCEMFKVLTMKFTEEVALMTLSLETPSEMSKTLQIILQDKQILISPSIQSVKKHWIEKLNTAIQIVEHQLQLRLEDEVQAVIFRYLLAVDSLLESGKHYLEKWKRIERALVGEEVFSSGDIHDWIDELKTMLALRRVIDSSESHSIGCLIFQYGSIRHKLLSLFDEVLGNTFELFKLKTVRFLSLTTKSIKDAQTFFLRDLAFDENLPDYIDRLFSCENEYHEWIEVMNGAKDAQTLMSANKVVIPDNWIYLEYMQNLLDNVHQLITRRQSLLKEDAAKYQLALKSAAEVCLTKIALLTTEWAEKKPVTAMQPSDALFILNHFSDRYESLMARKVLLLKVSSILGATISFPIANVTEEIEEMKTTLTIIQGYWDSLVRIKSQSWKSLHPRSLKQQLEEVLRGLNSEVTLTKLYVAYNDLLRSIKTHLADFHYVIELKNASLRERHWKKLGVTGETVGDILAIDFLMNESAIKSLILEAKSEFAIEKALANLKEEWKIITFETFQYSEECRLVKNWDELFENCNRSLSTLANMGSSMHSTYFERDRADLHEQMSELLTIFNLWIEVQRQWIYLDGIFDKNDDIKTALPLEVARYSRASFEFLDLMKRLNNLELVIDVLSFKNIKGNFEKIDVALEKTRIGLTEFLETQRERFPRFYFVGNEDLLEILGSGKDLKRLSLHVNNMFPGVAKIVGDDTQILLVESPEGEVVHLRTPISLVKSRDVTTWLIELDEEIKRTLSYLIIEAVVSYKSVLNTYDVLPFVQNTVNQAALVASKIAFSEDRSDRKVFLAALTLCAKEEVNVLTRKKLESMIIETIHQQDILASSKASLLYQSYRLRDSKVVIAQGNCEFDFGYEYQGVVDKLAYTPLIDDCSLAMTQALAQKLGGSPFGPAGTGKTESVKCLAQDFGRLVKVFCCDENFDYHSMSRIFTGLCRVGAWGCFDEFNRLSPHILSSIATQIELIQSALKNGTGAVMGDTTLEVKSSTALFVTMNPGYAGRHDLPENLKKLFRSFSMVQPEALKIADVLLKTQSFQRSHEIASLLLPLMNDFQASLSKMLHYDFGLRAVKVILKKCGHKRRSFPAIDEFQVVVTCLWEEICPKLTRDDEALLGDLIKKYFPGVEPHEADMDFVEKFKHLSIQSGLLVSPIYLKKAVQLANVQRDHHGVMLLGKAGSGKTTTTKKLLESFSGEAVTIDCKVLTKAELFGKVDHFTREWSDGLLTKIFRRVGANLKGEQNKPFWIVLDGDIDPDWAENLNSVLDDNKVLTLPNGERLSFPLNMRLLFEVDDISHATMATISRCGMVWFERTDVTREALFKTLKGEFLETKKTELGVFLDKSSQIKHIMNFEEQRAITSFTSIMNQCGETENAYQYALAWGLGGDLPNDERRQFMKDAFDRGPDLSEFANKVEEASLDPLDVLDSSTMVETVDSLANETIIGIALNQHIPLILCGPPGSGKTMTLLKVLRKSPIFDTVILNFSKDTTPKSLLNSLLQSCSLTKASEGYRLTPRTTGKWTVVFCDEINLPTKDKYGTQLVVSLIRQMVEQNGFWHPEHLEWVHLERIQFVGACNDPNDPGRSAMSPRFVRHCMVLMMDYPSEVSLKTIYHAFNNASLKFAPTLRKYSNSLTSAMLQVYYAARASFTERSHYIFSPRELTRWCRGVLETLMESTYKDVNELVRLWFHEGLRLFSDRLVHQDEKNTFKSISEGALRNHFPHTDFDVVQERLFFSKWLSLSYEEVKKEPLEAYVVERLKVFSEEETSTELYIHSDLLDHILRIDRVLRQRQGHMILAGSSSCGKTTLTRFVAWMNGLKVVPLDVYLGYTVHDFERKLREILLFCAKGELVCFLINEASILESSFVERMNTLLANSEVPGLFKEDDLRDLYKICKNEALAQGILLDSDEELQTWFVSQVSIHLHVVFTLDNESENLPQVHQSPALYNRCVLNWMGDWTEESLLTIASTKVQSIPLDVPSFEAPITHQIKPEPIVTFRDACVECCVSFHKYVGTYPLKFIELLDNFLSLFFEAQADLVESQRLVSAGLDKLRETVLQVTEMKEELKAKSEVLDTKNKNAKAMLNKMIHDQNEAERRREFSVEAQKELTKQENAINERREIVLQDLELAEPAVLEAQRGVQNIKKQHLTELRSMSHPPQAVRMAMESVCCLLGYDVKDWRDVQLVVRKDDFIASIVSYNNEEMLTPELRQFMEDKYLSRPDYNFETINHASKACGPLLQWVIAQLRYLTILDKVGPLKEEVELLEHSAIKSRAKLIAIGEMIEELEQSIETYKDDYSELIRETERVREEIKRTTEKLVRSNRIIEGLSAERSRWKESMIAFKESSMYMVGNALLAAGFNIYMGPLNQAQREKILLEWKLRMRLLHIPFDESLTPVALLTNPGQISLWSGAGLAYDELFIENFAIMEHSRLGFVVDPSGTVPEVISKTSKAFIETSFLSDAMVNQVCDAARFGGTVLVKHAESYNHVLDPFIRGDITGGKVHINHQDVEVLEQFRLVLYTQVNSPIPAFLAARAAVVNFTITDGNLANQVLNMALEHEDADLFRKRKELLVLQSGFRARLHEIRKAFLTILGSVSGSILDDDTAITAIEKLQVEAAEIERSISDSGDLVAQVDKKRLVHSDLAEHSKKIMGVLARLSDLHRMYSLSVERFLAVVQEVIRDCQALDGVLPSLYEKVYAVFSLSVKRTDRTALGVALKTVRGSLEIDAHLRQSVVEMLKSGGADSDASFSEEIALGFLKPFALLQKGEVLFSEALSQFALTAQETSLRDWVQTERPVIVASSANLDMTLRIVELGKDLGHSVETISAGTREGVEKAELLMGEAAKSGGWVVVQNVQMSPEWLAGLEARLPFQFGLFLTCDIESNLPSGLIAASTVLTYESAPDWKRLMLESLAMVQAVGPQKQSLLVWFHVVLIERMRYVPQSFSEVYDFSDADLRAAAFAIANVELWPEMAALVGGIVYGGKVSDAADKEYCLQLARNVFEKQRMGDSPVPHRFKEWVEQLPEKPPVDWIDLETGAETAAEQRDAVAIAQRVIEIV